MEALVDFSLSGNTRAPKHGWFPGFYCCSCRNCSENFIGAKGAWHCSNCAYDFDEQLSYEKLWRDFGWAYTAEYITKRLFKRQASN
jgi:hypothetical protein